ncbi:MAG: substrate-binding domain-containing protein [Candidatus Puniceispirillales bacterium]
MRFTPIVLGLTMAVSVAGAAQARDQISIVGSSTVYPFATIVAEKFGQSSGFKTPVIESTGSGGGMKLFCAGVGLEHPDITNASRAIKSKEVTLCESNGVEFQEFIVGNDGLAFANSNKVASFNISIAHIAAALAAELPGGGDTNVESMASNKLTTWADVDNFVASRGLPKAGLPAQPISVMVPPPTSGTRDAMGSLFMKNGFKKLGIEGDGYKSLREDGLAIEMGENDALIVEKLTADPNMFGIFGFSFFDQNRDKVHASVIDGVELTFDNIASYAYPGARPLFFYVKKQHVGVVPGLKEFVSEFVSEKAMSIDGYLFPAGLVPLSDSDFATQSANLGKL